MHQAIISGKEISLEETDGQWRIHGTTQDIDVVKVKPGFLSIIINHKPVEAELISMDRTLKTVVMMINNVRTEVTLKDSFDLLLKDMGMDQMTTRKMNDIKAPMPGLVLKVLVSEGQEVKKGENILVLEAMKMENMLKAADDCVVKKISVQAGDKVEKNQVLIQL